MILQPETKQKLLARLEHMAERHREVEAMLADPQVVGNRALLAKVAREHGYLSKFVQRRRQIQQAQARRAGAEQMLRDEPEDEEIQQLTSEEIEEAAAEEEQLLAEVVELMVSDEAERHSSVIVEIRAGTGGEEAALFAGDLFGMYSRYAERNHWRTELMDSSSTDLGGLREVVFSITGTGAWEKLRHESGGHRVQRVPQTESQGRIHTSLATVAVLPDVEDVDIQIDPSDLDISYMRSSGPGGQHVNKTSSCVRIVHKPSGITVRCQDEKSQQVNRKKAMKILRARLYEHQQEELHQERDAIRRSQVGSGDRNERIRTYNFPQDRITDHRIGLDVFGIESFLMGDCDRMFDPLGRYYKDLRIKELIESGTGETPTGN